MIIPAVSNIVEPKGEGGGKTCPQEEINAPTLKGPKNNPITMVLAINSSSSSMHFFLHCHIFQIGTWLEEDWNFKFSAFFCIATFSKRGPSWSPKNS